MENPEFHGWLDNGSGPCWIYGIPGAYLSYMIRHTGRLILLLGCGKTVMSTFFQSRLWDMGRPIIQFFCKNDEVSKRRPPFIVATLLSQLLDHPELERYQDIIAGHITKVYNKFKDISKVSMDKLCELLEVVLSTLPPVMITIDALDECEAESLSRSFLIERLIQLSSKVAGTKIIFTSRQEEPFIETFQSCTSLEMSKDNVADDIEAVVTKTVERIPKLQALKDKVISRLIEGADGMFLWAELMVATLKKARNRNAVERMLTNLPVGLSGVYEHILISIGQRLSEEELQLRREILGWVTTAARPMTLEELSVALAIQPGTNLLDDGEIILKLENDIRDLCGPMLSIFGDRTVQVVHMSVRDMLHCPMKPAGKVLQDALADQRYLVGFSSQTEHARLASACVSYLAFETFRDEGIVRRVLCSREELPLIAKEHVMLEYATLHWIHHVATSGKEGHGLLSQILKFLQADNSYVWIQLMTSFSGRQDANFSVHILQRSRLLDWVKILGKSEDSEIAKILRNYLIRAIETGVRLSEALLGSNHVQTLKALQRLGCLYDHEDLLEEARRIQQKIVDVTSGTSDPEAQTIFKKSCIELSYIYRVKGEYAISSELLQRVLGGPDPNDWTYDRLSAEAMADLGVVHRLQRNLDKAREMAERGAEGLTATLGPNHLMTIRYVIQLCRTYFECSLYSEAQSLLEETLKTADEAIGPEESATLHGRDLLGNILHARGDLDAAEKLLREVLRLMRQQWGESGRSTALLKTHVADVIVDKGELSEAIQLYQGATETYEGLHGLEHPDTQAAAVKLARCYSGLGLNDSAETIMVKYRLTWADVDKVGASKRTLLSTTKEQSSTAEKSKGEIVVEERAVENDEDGRKDVKMVTEKLKGEVLVETREEEQGQSDREDIKGVVGVTNAFEAVPWAVAF
jgi:tetratricopeptide (TPR) repeat protein